MKHKCYISFKYEDKYYKEYIQKHLDVDMIDKSLNEEINSINEDYIMQRIRTDCLADSTVTFFLIGSKSSESLGWYEQRFIKRELQASLYNGSGNARNGILGIVLPSMYDRVYCGIRECSCHQNINVIDVINTTVKEFSYNYFIPNNKCHHSQDDRYCILVKWDDFKTNPEKYIEDAYNKRIAPIAEKVKVKP